MSLDDQSSSVVSGEREEDHAAATTSEESEQVFSYPVKERSAALSALARLLHKQVNPEALIAGLPIGAQGLTDDIGVRSLRRLGLVSQDIASPAIEHDHLPCCACLNDGTYVVIIEISGDDYVIADLKIRDGVKRVRRDALDESYAGQLVLAAQSLDDIERRIVSNDHTGHWFWDRLRARKSFLRDIILGSFFANLLAVAVSLFSLQVYDRVIPHQSQATLWVLVAGAAMAIVLEASLRIARAHLVDASGRRVEIELSRFLFERTMGMRLSAERMGPSAMVSAVRDFASVREFFTAATIGAMTDLPFVVIFLAVIYAIAGNVVFVIIAAMAVIITPSLLARGKIAQLTADMNGGASAANRVLVESAYSPETVKTLRAESFFQNRWEEILTLNTEKTTEQRDLTAKLTFSAQAIQQSAYVLAIVSGVYLVFAGEFTVGAIIAISILSSRTLAPVTQLAGIISRWQQVKTSLKALDQIAESTQDRPADRTFVKREVLSGAIDIKGAKFSYSEDGGDALAIDQLAIKPGESVAILGANGSGKSTLLKVISGLYDTSAGSISLDGIDLRQLDPDDLRRHVGFLPQEVKLFSGSLRENLTLGSSRWSEAELFQALNFAGLSRVIQAHSRGLDLEIRDGGEGLSVGQKQCVGLARLYLQDPAIVLLDEPTASLDQMIELQIINALKSWIDKRTCVLTTHRVGILKLSERIVVLQNGVVARDGERDEVIEQLRSNSVHSLGEGYSNAS